MSPRTLRHTHRLSLLSLLSPSYSWAPYESWFLDRVTITPDGTHWQLVDFQQTGASDTRKFSPETWKDTMDSGRDWRRVRVS